MDFRKTETNLFFEFCPRGGGVWGGIRAGFFSDFLWGKAQINIVPDILIP
jgi:hypothetical protein